ncbi:nuclear transport factor 2 family protein [Streptomyces bobili]|uniref:nuclear transport factor 2 family protein n=1 Tax=Streptomyces bobili TaxID=67280 RepID=UPI0033BF6E74
MTGDADADADAAAGGGARTAAAPCQDASTEPLKVVEEFWDRMQARDWTGLGDLLAEDVVVERPVSGERIEGRGNFMSVNSECPEGWAIKVLRLLPSGDVVVSEVEVPHETMGVHRVVSFWSGPSRKDRRRSGVLDGAGVGPVAGVAGRVCAAHVIMCGRRVP